MIPVGSQLKTVGASTVLFEAVSGGFVTPSVSSNSKKWYDIMSEAENKVRPIVLFAEGTTSNGKGLLAFQRGVFDGLDKKVDLCPIVIKHNPPMVTTPLPGSWFKWLLSISMLVTGVKTSVKLGAKTSTTVSNNIEQSLAEGALRYGRLKKLGTSLDVESKKKFLTAYKKGRW